MILPLHGHLHGVRLSDFVDGELDPDEAHDWRRHLLECAACSAAVSAERSLRARMRQACVPLPPSTLMMSLRVVAVAGRPGSVAPDPDEGHRRRGHVPGYSRRLPIGMIAVTTSAAAVAVVGLAVTVLVTPAAPVGSPRPGAAVTVAPAALVPAALMPAAAPLVPAALTRSSPASAPSTSVSPVVPRPGTAGTTPSTAAATRVPVPLATAQR
ncbi:MAG: zf-HC2 domain-containing protein [Kineosporiaceae bacterium]